MDINELIAIVKKKIKQEIELESIDVEDKTFLHKSHSGHTKDKFHLKISIKSMELKKFKKLDSNKKIYKILKKEIDLFIHSIQILIN